jgi:hypothetical protein
MEAVREEGHAVRWGRRREIKAVGERGWRVYPLIILSGKNDFKRGKLVSVNVSRLEYAPVDEGTQGE